ncbi:MAG TPA: hypothetical protein VMU83_22795 [Hanamia sp.]|nr:hypothetical protein [Hanamia sp.]
MPKQLQQIFLTTRNIVSTNKNYLKNIFLFIYVVCIMLFALHAFKRQEYNWDMLPYMSIILSYDNNNLNFVHDTIYKIIKEQASVANYKLLTDGGLKMRKLSAENASYFKQQLPFYTVKPLYTKLAYFLYKAGIPLTEATVLLSVISYFFIGLFIFYWLKKYMNLFLVLPSCLLIMLCRPVYSVADISTPDCLSALFLLAAFYCLIEKKSVIAICIFLILSIFTRIDNIIPGAYIILLITLTNKWKEKISFKKCSFILMAMCISYFLITYNVREYGWNIFYYPSFLSHLNKAYDSHLSFSFSNYFLVAKSQIMSGLFFSDLILFLLLGLMLFIDRASIQRDFLNFEQLLIIVLILIIFTRFILQPIISDRFYIAYYISILVLVIKKIGSQNVFPATSNIGLGNPPGAKSDLFIQ